MGIGSLPPGINKGVDVKMILGFAAKYDFFFLNNQQILQSKKNVVGDYWPLVKNLQWLDTTQLFMQYKPVNFTELCDNKR